VTHAQIRRLEASYRRALGRADDAREKRDAGIRQAHDEGHSLRDLADVLGVSRQYIHKVMRAEQA
jgi:AraC-like DNA-binding protein